eukprot:scaffold137695_cov27-Tisochrysis_lutea.AAC.2
MGEWRMQKAKGSVCAFPRASAGQPGKRPKGGVCALLGADCRYLHKYARPARSIRHPNATIVEEVTPTRRTLGGEHARLLAGKVLWEGRGGEGGGARSMTLSVY